eukprot:Gb_02263 [translate_table: standard]
METPPSSRAQSPVKQSLSSSSSSRTPRRESNKETATKIPSRKSSTKSDDSSGISQSKQRSKNRFSTDSGILREMEGSLYNMESEAGFGEDEDWTDENTTSVNCSTSNICPEDDEGDDAEIPVSIVPPPRGQMSEKSRKQGEISQSRTKAAPKALATQRKPSSSKPEKQTTVFDHKPSVHDRTKQPEIERRVSVRTAKEKDRHVEILYGKEADSEVEPDSAREYFFSESCLQNGDVSEDVASGAASPSPCTTPTITSRSCSPDNVGVTSAKNRDSVSTTKSRETSPTKSRTTTPVKTRHGPPPKTSTNTEKRGSRNNNYEPADTASKDAILRRSSSRLAKSRHDIDNGNDADANPKELPGRGSRFKTQSDSRRETRSSVTTAKKSILKSNTPSTKSESNQSTKPETSRAELNSPVSNRSAIPDSRKESATKIPVDRRDSGTRRSSANKEAQAKDAVKKDSNNVNRRNSKTLEEYRPSSRQSLSRNSDRPASQIGQIKDIKEELDSTETERGKMKQQVIDLVDRSLEREKELESICADRDRGVAEIKSLTEELENWKNKCIGMEETFKHVKKSVDPGLSNSMAVDIIVEENAKWTKLLQAQQLELNALKADQKTVYNTLLSTKIRLTDLRQQLSQNSLSENNLEKEQKADIGSKKLLQLSKSKDNEHQEDCEDDAQALALDLETEVLGLIEEAKDREQNFEAQRRDLYKQNENLKKEKQFFEAKLERTLTSMEEFRHNCQQWESEREQLESIIINKSNKLEELAEELDALSDELHMERSEKRKLANLYLTAKKMMDELSAKEGKMRKTPDYSNEEMASRKDTDIDRLMEQMAGVERELRDLKTKATMAVAGFIKEPAAYNDRQKRPRKRTIDPQDERAEDNSEAVIGCKHRSKEELLANLRNQIFEAASLIADFHGDKTGNSNILDSDEGLNAWRESQKRVEMKKSMERQQWEHEIRRLLDGKQTKTADTLRTLSGVVQELESSL